MNTSTTPTVKQAIVTVLAARAGLAGVQVKYAHPGNLIAFEAIFLGQARGRHDIAALRQGRKPRDEEYAIDLFVAAGKDGGDVQASEARAFALLGEVESALADDPKLGTSVLHWAKAGEWELDSELTPEGAVSVIRLEIDCKARLT